MLQGTETRDGCAELSLPIGGEGNMYSPFSSSSPHQIVLCIGLNKELDVKNCARCAILDVRVASSFGRLEAVRARAMQRIRGIGQQNVALIKRHADDLPSNADLPRGHCHLFGRAILSVRDSGQCVNPLTRAMKMIVCAIIATIVFVYFLAFNVGTRPHFMQEHGLVARPRKLLHGSGQPPEVSVSLRGSSVAGLSYPEQHMNTDRGKYLLMPSPGPSQNSGGGPTVAWNSAPNHFYPFHAIKLLSRLGTHLRPRNIACSDQVVEDKSTPHGSGLPLRRKENLRHGYPDASAVARSSVQPPANIARQPYIPIARDDVGRARAAYRNRLVDTADDVASPSIQRDDARTQPPAYSYADEDVAVKATLLDAPSGEQRDAPPDMTPGGDANRDVPPDMTPQPSAAAMPEPVTPATVSSATNPEVPADNVRGASGTPDNTNLPEEPASGAHPVRGAPTERVKSEADAVGQQIPEGTKSVNLKPSSNTARVPKPEPRQPEQRPEPQARHQTGKPVAAAMGSAEGTLSDIPDMLLLTDMRRPGERPFNPHDVFDREEYRERYYDKITSPEWIKASNEYKERRL